MSAPESAHDGASESHLAQEVDELRCRVDRLTEDLDRALALVDETLSAVSTGGGGETARTGRQSASSSSSVPPTWCSRDLAGEDASQFYEILDEWVQWLRGRYPIAKELPECWAHHPELVEELTALYAAWHGAYRDRQALSWAPADWHDRWLSGFLGRVSRWGVTCTDGDHRERGARTYERTQRG